MGDNIKCSRVDLTVLQTADQQHNQLVGPILSSRQIWQLDTACLLYLE